LGGEPQPLEASRQEPVDHDIVQASAVTLPLMRGFDEQSPNVSGDIIADGKGHH
jgi:hypothetical protein